MTSPTARTKQFFEKQGAEVVILERWNQYARRRQDVWGADMLVRQGRLLMAIQATSATNHSHRVEKSKADPHVMNWLKGGIPFYIYSWGKKGPRGHRKTWESRITQLVEGTHDKVIEL